MNKKVTTVAMMALAMALASCSTTKKVENSQEKNTMDHVVVSGSDDPMDEGYLILTDAQRKIVGNNNAFALNLFKEVSGFDSRVVSPMSVSYLMGMLANGADGQTREEIMNAIGCKGVSLQELNEFYKLMLAKSGNFDKQVTISIANYIALNKQYSLKKPFADIMKSDYQAGVESLDFGSPATTQKINGWCDKQTHGMIPSIIDQVEADAVSYIMNAIYFNGTWTDKFDKSETKLERFQGYTRDIKKTQMMHRNGKYMFTDNNMFSAVSIPYGSGTYQMTVLLPNRDKSIDELLKSLDADKLSKLRYDMDDCVVDLKLPRFSTELDLPLNDIISKLGAPTMFTGGADFHNFADGNLFISKMFQKAKIEVSEEGTKAAAVTAAIMTMSALRPEEPRHVEFHADHPFVYMITESSTGAILFMGQFTGSEL